MPELPEVEVVRAQLDKALQDKSILQTRVFKTKWARIPLKFNEDLNGRTVTRVLRHGKYLFFDLEEKYLMAHLGMSGSFRVARLKDRKAEKHDHYGLRTDANLVYYNDPRRFGRIDIISKEFLPEFDDPRQLAQGLDFYSLGPDALTRVLEKGDKEDAVKLWWKRLHGIVSAKTEIKNALLNQSMIAGIGNIYASEILFRARIHPRTLVGDLDKYQVGQISLFSSKVLRQAIENGGTTFSGANKYENTQGGYGQNAKNLAVYGREGEACYACRKPIRKRYQMGRATYYCAKCQKH